MLAPGSRWPPDSHPDRGVSEVCGKGTFNGNAASVAKYGFAPCALDKEHPKDCDSGPAPLDIAA